MDKAELIHTMREAYHRVAGAIEHVPDERLLEPAMDDWTGKDLLAHMAWWHDHSARVIEGLRAGRQPYDVNDPANSTDALNERTHREHLDDPPELTRRAFDESFKPAAGGARAGNGRGAVRRRSLAVAGRGGA
ncbi:MAG: ClbS/DfsB family four-helix bundle protein [Actinobacteria bacterium]|nr:MAG: ClbS/DfsB family four-helix bundle protein [Actinomycetota bacterium]